MESCFLIIEKANYWRHSEVSVPDTTTATLVNIPSVVTITISHSATIANATATNALP